MNRFESNTYEFGQFRLDATKRLLYRDGEAVPLTSKSFDILLELVLNREKVLEKAELMQRVWPDSFVEEGNLTQNISILRKALGESPNEHRFILTVPGRGYRFVANVHHSPDQESGSPTQNDSTASAKIRQTDSTNDFSDTQLSPSTTQSDDRQFLRSPTQEDFTSITDAQKQHSSDTRKRRKRLTLLALSLFLVGFIITFRVWLAKQPKSVTEVKSIAVLPFKMLNSEVGEEYLELGLADALITKLNRIKQISVRPTSAITRYVNSEKEAPEIGRDLGVEALLDGRIQRVGDRIRVTVQLIRASDGTSIWAEGFDGRFTDILGVQDSISEQVVKKLEVNLSGKESQQLAKNYTQNVEAYKLYLQGRGFWNRRTQDDLKISIEHYEKAIALDPNYALAYAGLAESYALLNLYSAHQMKDAFPKARAAAEKALAIDDSLAEAHTALAYVKEQYDWDWEAAEREFKKALDLNENYPTAHHWYSEYLALTGRTAESIEHIKRAQDVDPTSLIIHTQSAYPYFCARQYDSAIDILNKVIEKDENFSTSRYYLARCYEQKALYEEAIAEYKKAIALSGGSSLMLARLGCCYAVSGRMREAKEVLKELKKLSTERYVSPFSIAILHAAFGEKEQAMVLLEKAYEDRDGLLVVLKVDAHLDSLRSESRFMDLLHRVGFKP
jgi:DNA-binding winged helix-turn-helix (wHTH) protein/TolB-like protein/Tfp pilus assembly protein PilF